MRRARGGAAGPAGSTQPWSVRSYLLLIVAAAVVAVGAASAYGFLWSAKEARDGAMDDMALQAKRAAESAGEALATAQQTVVGLAAQPGLVKVFAKPEDCSLAASAGLRLDIVGPAGGVVCSSDPKIVAAGVHAGSDWLGPALRSPELVVDADATDAATGRRAVVLTAPVDKADPAAGVVALFVEVPALASGMAHDYAGSDDVSFTLVDRGT
jgi:hypothetical protein